MAAGPAEAERPVLFGLDLDKQVQDAVHRIDGDGVGLPVGSFVVLRVVAEEAQRDVHHGPQYVRGFGSKRVIETCL